MYNRFTLSSIDNLPFFSCHISLISKQLYKGRVMWLNKLFLIDVTKKNNFALTTCFLLMDKL